MTTFIRPVQNQANGNTYVEIRNADGTPASIDNAALTDVWNSTDHWLGVSLITKLQALVSGTENDNILIMPGRRADAFNDSVLTGDATSLVVLKAATTNKSIYITDIVISTDTAGWIEVKDDASAIVILRKYFPANSIWSKSYKTPKKVAVSQGVKFIAQNVGNISVGIDGYVI